MIQFTATEDRIVKPTTTLSDKFSDKFSVNLSDKEVQTLEFLQRDPGYTTTQLAEALHVSRVSVTNYLKSLKDKGIIERVGSDRKGYWKLN